MRWPWNNSKNGLLEALLAAETARVKAAAETEQKRLELELKRAELEIQNAEQLAKARSSERVAAEELRQKRREHAAEIRKLAGPANAQRRAQRDAVQNCRVCANDHDISLSAQEIAWHRMGHPANGVSLESLWPN